MKNSVSLLAIAVALSMPLAFANANAGSKFYICAVNQESDLDRSGYEALTWVEIKGIGSVGEVGSSTNILNYDTWDTTVTQKAKGITDAGSPEIELARIPTDPGQILMRTASANNLNYAFKMLRNDPTNATGTPTVIYNRGLVTGPKRPMGKNEDFDLEVFTLGLNQKEVVVDATAAGNPPVNTVLPAITGTATVGQTLTSTTGTFTGDATITYTRQWRRGGVNIAGATDTTYVLVAADLGKIITVVVAAFNASGFASAQSAATATVT